MNAKTGKFNNIHILYLHANSQKKIFSLFLRIVIFFSNADVIGFLNNSLVNEMGWVGNGINVDP